MFTVQNQEIDQIVQMVHQFVEKEVEPLAQQIEDEDRIPDSLVQQVKELGLFGMSIPEEYGGIGLGMVGKTAVLEQLGRTHNGFVSLISAHTGIGSTGLVRLGSPYLKEKYLPALASGEKIACFALSEPGAGSDATNLATKAEKREISGFLMGQNISSRMRL